MTVTSVRGRDGDGEGTGIRTTKRLIRKKHNYRHLKEEVEEEEEEEEECFCSSNIEGICIITAAILCIYMVNNALFLTEI